METEAIKNQVYGYILKEYLDDDETGFTCDTRLISGGIVDSFAMVSLLVFIEHAFKVNIPPAKATPAAFDTVNNIVNLVNQHLNTR